MDDIDDVQPHEDDAYEELIFEEPDEETEWDPGPEIDDEGGMSEYRHEHFHVPFYPEGQEPDFSLPENDLGDALG